MDVIQLVAEPRRRQIMQLIWEQELPVTEIAGRLGISVAAASQHLARLKGAGVVTAREDGKLRLYRAKRGGLGYLAPLLELMWASDLERVAQASEREAEGRDA